MMRTIFLLILLAAHSSLAQDGATLRVRVVDVMGAGVSGARVVVEPLGWECMSALNGVAEFTQLGAGTYHLFAEHERYVSAGCDVTLSTAGLEAIEIVVESVAHELTPVTIETSANRPGVRLFSRARIEQSGAASVAEFLRREGFDLRTDGGEGSVAVARIGGSNANQVTVLFDGQRLNSAASGMADLSQVPLTDIDEILVTRGSDPVLAGDGIGGVISLTSREIGVTPATEAGLDIRSYLGRYYASRAQIISGVAGHIEYSKVRGSGEYRYRVSADDAQGERDPHVGNEYRRLNNEQDEDRIAVRLQRVVGSQWRLHADGLLQHGTRGMPGYLVPNLTPLAAQTSSLNSGNARLLKTSGRLTGEARLTVREEARSYTNPESAFIKYSEEKSGSTGLAGDVRTVIAGFGARGGAEVRREQLRGTLVESNRATRERAELWGKCEREWNPAALHAWTVHGEAAVRQIWSGTTDYLTPRVGLQCSRTGRIAGGAAASWGRSFRSPDLYSLFWLEDQFASGNPDLQPEQSEDRFAEAWIERGTLQKSALHIRVGDQSVERLIAWRASFDGRWKPTNIPRARIQTLGLEFEQAVLGEHLQLQGGAEWTEARDAGSDRNTANKYLTFRAPRVFRGSLESRWGHFSGSLGYRYVDARPATDSNTKWLSAYRLVDAMLEYEIGIDRTRVACRAGLSNGLNEDYRIVRHAPLPLREFLVGIRFTPKGTEK